MRTKIAITQVSPQSPLREVYNVMCYGDPVLGSGGRGKNPILITFVLDTKNRVSFTLPNNSLRMSLLQAPREGKRHGRLETCGE